MKIKITIAGNDRTAIVLPVANAGIAAELMAHAVIYERDGYSNNCGWKPAEQGVQISYSDGAELEPTHPLVEAANEALSKKNQQWYEEYTKRVAADKELAETRAALEALRSVTVCQTVAADETVSDETQEESRDEEE